MLFMVVEQFKNHNARQVFRRAQEKGRMLPNGLNYIDSWVGADFDRCFQLMETENPKLFRKSWNFKPSSSAFLQIVFHRL